MVFDVVSPKVFIMNDYFCRSRHKKRNMFYLSQNTFSSNREIVKENFNLFKLFGQRGKVLETVYYVFKEEKLRYKQFAKTYN